MQHAYHQALNRRRYLSLRGRYDAWSADADLANLSSSRAMSAVDAERLIQDALTQLSRRQRETLELAFYDGLTMQEIAERTGQSYANIRHHYYRGLEKLRDVLGHAKSDEQPGSATVPAWWTFSMSWSHEALFDSQFTHEPRFLQLLHRVSEHYFGKLLRHIDLPQFS